MGISVVVHSPRGGAGTSTLALALAQKLASQSHPTCLVELATFGSIVPMLKLPEHPGWTQLASYLEAGGESGDDIVPVLQAALADLSEYTSSPLWGLHAAATVMDRLGAAEAEAVLFGLESMFECVVVDAPAELSERTAAAFTLGRPVVILCPPDFQNAYRLLQLHGLLTQLQVEPARVVLIGNHAVPDGGPGLSDLAALLPYRVVGQVPLEKSLPATVARSRWSGFKRGSAPDQVVDRLAELVMAGTRGQASPSGSGASAKGVRRMGARA